MRYALLVFCSAMAVITSCGGDTPKLVGTDRMQPTFTAEGGTPEEQLLADLRNRLSGNAKVRFHATLEAGEEHVTTDVTWYTDGSRRRQRFDFDDAKELVGLEHASVFTSGDRERTVLCSPEFPVDPNATSLDAPGLKGACCEGKSSCGDLAGNVLLYLGFPGGYPEAGKEPEIPHDSNLEVERRKIAGVDARCYRDSGGQDCFTAAGAQVYWKREKNFLEGALEVQAFEVSTSVADDFDYPYAVYLDPNEMPRTPTPASQ